MCVCLFVLLLCIGLCLLFKVCVLGLLVLLCLIVVVCNVWCCLSGCVLFVGLIF